MPDKKTIGDLFLQRISHSKKDNSIGWIENFDIKFIDYQNYMEKIVHLANEFHGLGLERGSRLAIIGHTCKEWHFCDLANLCIGCAVVPVYPSYTPEEIAYVFNHSECTHIVVEDEALFLKVVAIQEKLPNLKVIIGLKNIPENQLIKIKPTVSYISYQELQAKTYSSQETRQRETKFKELIQLVSPDDLATIVYTSGTTGEPKGAIIKHGATLAMLENTKLTLSGTFSSKDRSLIFLPLSHVLGRADSLIPLVFGGEMVYARSLDTIIEDITIVKPSVMIGVPRIFEKIYDKIILQVEKSGSIKKKIFNWANSVSNQYFSFIEKDQTPPPLLSLQRKLAYNKVFSKIYAKFGGRLRFFISGGAPLSMEIMKFLRNANLCILEGYGLTETIAPFTVNPPYRQIPGTVGIPTGTGEIKIAEDGEILLRSEGMFSGYYKNQKDTEAAFVDGWFRTGDIGEMTREGYLKITDRKKDLIITSGGKNIAPQKIENLLKTNPLISQVLVVGDKRKFLTAVISIEKASFMDSLEELKLPRDCSVEDLSKHPEIVKIIEKSVDTANQTLASFETIKKFYVAPEEFSVEGGQLTPSLKLKKKVVGERYQNQIDAMYKDA